MLLRQQRHSAPPAFTGGRMIEAEECYAAVRRSMDAEGPRKGRGAIGGPRGQWWARVRDRTGEGETSLMPSDGSGGGLR